MPKTLKIEELLKNGSTEWNRMRKSGTVSTDHTGATFENLVSGVTYLRNPSDAPVLRSMCRQRGFDGFPCALVHAQLCRPELLCETEAVAMLRLSDLADGSDPSGSRP